MHASFRKMATWNKFQSMLKTQIYEVVTVHNSDFAILSRKYLKVEKLVIIIIILIILITIIIIITLMIIIKIITSSITKTKRHVTCSLGEIHRGG